MRILIVGAAGKTGRELIRQALTRGYSVTAIAHHEPQPELPSAVRLFIGDARHRALLDQAVAGQNCVVDAIGTRKLFVATTLETDVARALLAAIDRHKVSRIAVISSLGVGTSRNHVNWLFRALIPIFFRGVMPDKEGMEAAFRASDCAWLIVRPSGLTQGPATNNIRVLSASSSETAFQIAAPTSLLTS